MSYRYSIAPKSKKVGRFLGQVRRELQKAFLEEKKARGLTQAQIARELGVDRSVVNRQLSGTENLTLRRLGEYGFIFGRDPHFSLKKPVMPAGANIPYPETKIEPPACATKSESPTTRNAPKKDLAVVAGC